MASRRATSSRNHRPRSRPRAPRYTFEALVDDYRRDHPRLFVSSYAVMHLRRRFGRRPVETITADSIDAYALARHEEERAPIGVINDELLYLGRMLRHAVDGGRLQRCPRVEYLQETSVYGLGSAQQSDRPPAGDRADVALRGTPVRPGEPIMHARGKGRPGRRPELDAEEILDNFVDHPATKTWAGSDEKRAQMLSHGDRHVSHDQVARARGNLKIPPSTDGHARVNEAVRQILATRNAK